MPSFHTYVEQRHELKEHYGTNREEFLKNFRADKKEQKYSVSELNAMVKRISRQSSIPTLPIRPLATRS